MNTTRSNREVADKLAMTSAKYGVRLVDQRPGSAEATDESIRWRLAQSSTVRIGSGARPLFQADSTADSAVSNTSHSDAK